MVPIGDVLLVTTMYPGLVRDASGGEGLWRRGKQAVVRGCGGGGSLPTHRARAHGTQVPGSEVEGLQDSWNILVGCILPCCSGTNDSLN
jgi:hypothetical protein